MVLLSEPSEQIASMFGGAIDIGFFLPSTYGLKPKIRAVDVLALIGGRKDERPRDIPCNLQAAAAIYASSAP